jgi:hypothetical protein
MFWLRMYSLIFPGQTSADVFINTPFSLTTAELHDIDTWEKVRATAPPQAYITKQLVGTPNRVDSVEADPACSFCNQPADNEMDETRFFCSVTVGRDIAARQLTMCGNHGLAFQLT